jgi:hypothetical protein
MTEGVKPAVSAFLCERVLTEKDGVQTYVRVVDSFTARVLPGGKARVQASLVVIIKSSEAGEHKANIRLKAPSDKVAPMGEEMPVALKGAEHGMTLNIMVVLDLEEEGIYTFEILLDGEQAMRVPLRVRLETLLPEPSRPKMSESEPPIEQSPPAE